jgi:hypothetical protein
MRNGGSARFSIHYETLVPSVADADPDDVSVKVRAPDGTETVWVYGTDPEVVRDNVGDYHFDSPALDYAHGGTYQFVALATDFPETKCEIQVEPTYW